MLLHLASWALACFGYASSPTPPLPSAPAAPVAARQAGQGIRLVAEPDRYNVEAQIALSKAALAPGEEAELTIALTIEPGWHAYPPAEPGAADSGDGGIPIELKLEGAEALGALVGPQPTPHGKSAVYEGKVELKQKLRAAASAAPMKGTLLLNVCNANTCLPPGEWEFEIASAAPATAAPNADGHRETAAAAPKKAGDFPIVEAPESYRVRPKFTISKAALSPGEQCEIAVELDIDAGWHVYTPTNRGFGLKTSVEAEGLELVDGLRAPEGKQHKGEDILEGPVTMKQTVAAPKEGLGATAPKLTLKLMVCDEKTCLPPAEWIVTVPVKASSSGAPAPTPSSAKPTATDQTSGIQRLQQLPLLTFLGTAALGGALSLLTPCVFPMVPITVSFFSKRSSGKRGRTLRLAITYALGIIGTFTMLGVAVSAFFGASGLNAFATNPWVNTGMGVLFVALGLSLLGLFQIQAPSGLTNQVESAKQNASNDTAMTLFMSVAFTLASFTCTVPILGALLVYSASGDLTRPILGMLAYSSTFAAPFFVLALFPSFLQRLPRGGAWLEVVKISMGLVEIAAALKFLSNADIAWDMQILTRPVFLALCISIFVALALYLFGLLHLPGAEGEVGPIRALFGVSSLAAALYLSAGLFGARFGGFVEAFLPPPNYGGGQSFVAGPRMEKHPEVAWVRDFDAALDQARKEKKRLLLNFTGFQ